MAMLYPSHPLAHVLAKDSRYTAQAYEFVFEALEFTRQRLAAQRGGKSKVKHVTARELLDGVRQLAIQQFGLMALTVLQSWGVQRTGDFGEIVFNLITSGDMEKTDEDSREDFDDVYDFGEVFCRDFKITLDQSES
jgi:uncharacterized repeat protein (TIGR04138 family)